MTRAKREPLDPEAQRIIKPTEETVAELIELATDVPEDSEELLAKLEDIQGRRTQWTSEKGVRNLEYVHLRDAATELLRDGPRYFIDRNGVKMVAIRRPKRVLEIKPNLITEIAKSYPELLDKICPRKVDNDALKRAVATRKIPATVLVANAKIVEQASHVQFIPMDPALREE